MPKRELTPEEVCEALDISDATLKLWREKGCPHAKVKGKACRYNLGEIAVWMQAEGLTGKHQTTAKERNLWDTRKVKALAERYELQLAKERGELISLADVERTYGNFIRVMRNRIMRIGVNVASRRSGSEAAKLQAELDAEAVEALREVSQTDEPDGEAMAATSGDSRAA